MKRIIVSGIVFLFGFVILLGKTDETNRRIECLRDSLEKSIIDIHRIESKQDILIYRIDAIDKLMEHSSSAITNELSASNKVLTVSSLVISLVAILLGIFVTWMQSKVSKISRTVQDLSRDVEKKKNEVERLVNEINTDFDSLFIRIRRADTLEYLKRLEDVPKDIANLSDLLLARELEPEDFQYLKNAYVKLVDSGDENAGGNAFVNNYGNCYRLLFFQHFCGQSVEDDFLRDRMVVDFERLVPCCFDNDIKKSLSELAPVLNKRDVTYDRVNILTSLLSALHKSKFKNNADVFTILKNGIADEELWRAANNNLKIPSDIQSKE